MLFNDFAFAFFLVVFIFLLNEAAAWGRLRAIKKEEAKRQAEAATTFANSMEGRYLRRLYSGEPLEPFEDWVKPGPSRREQELDAIFGRN